MQHVFWPEIARNKGLTLNVLAHSIGGESRGGHYAYATGPGAYWQGSMEIPSLNTADACDFRGFLHSLRGASGSFLLRMNGEPIVAAPLLEITCPRMDGKTRFADCEDFSDGTAFADNYLFIPPYTDRLDGKSRFADSTDFTDGTAFADDFGVYAVSGPDDNPFLTPRVADAYGELGANASIDSSFIAVDMPYEFRDALPPGTFLFIGNTMDGQLVRVVGASTFLTEVRPRLRQAFEAGTRVSVGRVYGKFRLVGEAPFVPMNGQFSQSVQIEFQEFH